MGRSRATAKAAGSAFERWVADFFRDHLSEFIDRRVKTGSADKGDIANVRTKDGQRVAVEVKNVAKTDLSGWLREAEAERVNDGAAVGVVVHKRVGKGEKQMSEQYVTMSLADFIVLLGGSRPTQE